MLFQNYLQTMHQFCQYPALSAELNSAPYSSSVHVLAIGKTAWKMASLTVKALQKRGIAYDGYVLTKYGHLQEEITGLIALEAGHPLPDENTLTHSSQIATWLQSIPAEEDLIVLLSGGSSALFEMIPEQISLQTLQKYYKDLICSGETIASINSKRTELSLVKGGKALELVKSNKVLVYAVSDVAHNDPQVIGSSPFTPLDGGERTEFGYLYTLENKSIDYRIVADNDMFCRLLATNLQDSGFSTHIDGTYYKCSVSRFSEYIREILRKASASRYRAKKPIIYVMGGELTLRVTAKGTGGRCSHLALSVANAVSKLPNTSFFCFATDGNDNLPGSGGAFVDSNSRILLNKAGSTITKTIKEYDSYTALSAIQHILPAPLLPTNVNDVFLLCVGYDFENPLPSDLDNEVDIFADSI